MDIIATLANHSGGQQARSWVSTKFLMWLLTQLGNGFGRKVRSDFRCGESPMVAENCGNQGWSRAVRNKEPRKTDVAAVSAEEGMVYALPTERGPERRVAPQPGYGIESIRSCVRQANIDLDHAPGGLSIVRCK